MEETSGPSKVDVDTEEEEEGSEEVSSTEAKPTHLSKATKVALVGLSMSGVKLDVAKLERPLPPKKRDPNSKGFMLAVDDGTSRPLVDMSREDINRKLLALMEDDFEQFTDFDVKELLPSTPFEDNSFSKLKDFFESIMGDLNTAGKAGVPLEVLKEEFQFLWEGIRKSHNNLEDLQKKDVELTAVVTDTMVKTRNLIKLAEDDPELCMRLANRLENAWNLLDISEEEEKRTNAKIEEFRTDIMIVNRNILIAANLTGKQELQEMQEIRVKLQEDRDSLSKEIGHLRTTNTLQLERRNKLEEDKNDHIQTIRYCHEESHAQEEAYERETQRIEKIVADMIAVELKIKKVTKELKDIEDFNNKAERRYKELDRGVASQKVINNASQKEADVAFAKLAKTRLEFDEHVNHIESLAVTIFKKQTELEEQNTQISNLQLETKLTQQQLRTNQKYCETLQQSLNEIDGDREALREKLEKLEKDLETARKKLEKSRVAVQELDKKRTIVNRNLVRANAVAYDHDHQLKVHMIAKNNLDMEMKAYKREMVTQKETVERLEKERDQFSHWATKLAVDFSVRLEEVKKMDTIVFEFRKKLGELDGNVKFKLQEYEQSLVERRFFESLLRDTRTSISYAMIEVRNNTFELNTEIFAYHTAQTKFTEQKLLTVNLLRQIEFFKVEAARVRKMAEDMHREVLSLEHERSLLGCQSAEANNELSKQRYYATQAESRKHNYNRRMQKTEDDLRDVWKTWRDLHSMVRIGAYHYRNIMREIMETRKGIMELRQTQQSFFGNTGHFALLEQEIGCLTQNIGKEICMVNSLQEEFSRPVNIHRWRALEAIDPDSYNTIKRINIVTKRLVDRNEIIRKQVMRLADKENIYIDLRQIVQNKLPGLESPELKDHFQVILDSKREQLRNLKKDLYENHCDMMYFRTEVAKINERMKDLRYDYLDRMEEMRERRKNPQRFNKSIVSVNPPTQSAITTFHRELPVEESKMEVDNQNVEEEANQLQGIRKESDQLQKQKHTVTLVDPEQFMDDVNE